MSEQLTTLTLDVQPGECVCVDGAAVVELVHKTGRAARVRVTARPEVKIQRIQLGDLVPSMAQSKSG